MKIEISIISFILFLILVSWVPQLLTGLIISYLNACGIKPEIDIFGFKYSIVESIKNIITALIGFIAGVFLRSSIKIKPWR